MNLRYIILSAYHSDFDDEFSVIFNDNTRFVSNWLSRRIRQFKIPTDGSYKMLYVGIHSNDNHTKIIQSANVLETYVMFSHEDMESYLAIKDKTILFEKYLSLLETGYRQAAEMKDVPIKELLNIHQEFRELGYRNEWNFKKMRLTDFALKVSLDCALTMDAFSLYLTVFDMKGNQLARECILKTFPDEIMYSKRLRKLVLQGKKLFILDFLDYPFLEIEIVGMKEGVIKYKMLEKHFEQYLAENNVEQMNKLAWI